VRWPARAHGSVVVGSLAWVWVAVAPKAASADSLVAQASLSYEREAGAEACPDEAALREQVALRLGYDPFQPEAPHRVSVRVDKGTTGFHARITTSDASAGSRGPASRDLDSEGDRCDELVQSIVLAVSLAIDPLSFGRPHVALPPPLPTPAAAASPEAAKVAAPATPPSPPSTTPWIFDLTATARAGFGLVPGFSIGPALDLRVGKKHWALLAQLGANLPVGQANLATDPTAGVEASLIRGGLGGCGILGWLSFCGRVDLGALDGRGTGLSRTSPDTTLYADVALSTRLDVPIASGVHASVGAELDAPFAATNLNVNEAPVWTTPTLTGSFDLGVGYRF
jgi:hypothetical protein